MLDATLTRNNDLALTDEQQDFVRSVRDFCEKEFPQDKLEQLTDGYPDIHNDDVARRML